MKLNSLSLKDNRIHVFYCKFFLLAVIIHLLLPLNWADDAVFFEKSSQLNLSEFISNSARPFVDTFTYFFTKYPLLWRLINPLMLILSSWLLSKYLPSKNDYIKNVALCFVLLYPSMIVVDAGFIATTLNYLWPVTLGLLCLLPIWKKLNNLRICYFEMILFIPCLLYSTNMQQMAVILVTLFGMANFYFALKKDFSLYIFLQFLISMFCLIYSYIINTVGENSRLIREMNRYFPNFDSLSFFKKIELGFSSTFYCLTMKPSFAWLGFFVFISVLVFLVFKKTKNIFNRATVSFPFLLSIWGIIQHFFSDIFSSLKKYIPGELQHYRMNKATYSFELTSDIIYIIVVLCILYSLFTLIKNKKVYVATLIIFFLGLGTRILMGFSPTVWASGYRTFYIMFLSLIVISFLVINENNITVCRTPKSHLHH